MGEIDRDGNNAAPALDSAYPRRKHRLAHRHGRHGCEQGGKLHRASGNVFTAAMLTLATSAFCLAILKSQQGNIVGSVGTFYLIGTAWLAGRRGERTRLIDWSALFIGLAGAVAAIALGVYTLHNPDGVDKTTAPAGMSFFFGAILLLATAGDRRMTDTVPGTLFCGRVADQPSRIAAYVQNSNRAWKAIIRGLLSPPKPTPSKPVGGEVADVSAPNPLCVEGFPGMPA
jgi:hypothetical protein